MIHSHSASRTKVLSSPGVDGTVTLLRATCCGNAGQLDSVTRMELTFELLKYCVGRDRIIDEILMAVVP